MKSIWTNSIRHRKKEYLKQLYILLFYVIYVFSTFYVLFIFLYFLSFIYYLYYNAMYANNPILGFEINISHLNFIGCGFMVFLGIKAIPIINLMFFKLLHHKNIACMKRRQ